MKYVTCPEGWPEPYLDAVYAQQFWKGNHQIYGVYSSIPARIHPTAGGGFYTCADTEHERVTIVRHKCYKKDGQHSASCAKRVPTDVRLHSPPRTRVRLHAAE